MVDMKPTIVAKSDQLNADDLVSGPITVTVTEVSLGSGADQPINIRYQGDNGKPWRPCKTMRRLLVAVWGDDGQKYVGQSMTLYRDPHVKWAGVEVGGIRISHMTGLTEKKVIVLQETKGKKKPVTVEPLQAPAPQQQAPAPQNNAPQYNGSPIADGDWQGWTQRMDEALTVEEITAIGKQIGEVAPNYDQASVDRLKAYYADRLRTIKGGQ